ncbi:MAG: hypothetical protein RML45_01735 [Acetobacteraceae bacterium]|nr:hypothetical protein [Acetobacteraceae bacterium]
MIAAVKRDTWLDRALSAASLFGVSLPGFWFGILLILLFAVELRLLPVGGRVGFGFDVPRDDGLFAHRHAARARPRGVPQRARAPARCLPSPSACRPPRFLPGWCAPRWPRCWPPTTCCSRKPRACRAGACSSCTR